MSARIAKPKVEPSISHPRSAAKIRSSGQTRPLRQTKPVDQPVHQPEVLVSVKPKKGDYWYAVGKRKSSSARVRLLTKKGEGNILINNKDFKQYFPYFASQQLIVAPLKAVGLEGKFDFTVRVKGGGINSQAESVRHGIARVLLKYDESLRKTLRAQGLLTRDPREKERKKPGLKRARRAPQWQKR